MGNGPSSSTKKGSGTRRGSLVEATAEKGPKKGSKHVSINPADIKNDSNKKKLLMEESAHTFAPSRGVGKEYRRGSSPVMITDAL
jgi:hypothetical protein